jgi:hypothetical protein
MQPMTLKPLLLGGLISLAISCGKSNSTSADESRTLGDLAYTIKGSNPDLITEPDKLAGTGTIAFLNPMAVSKDSGKHLAINFSLENEGSLKIQVFSDKELNNGLELSFKRSEQELQSILKLNNQETILSKVQDMGQLDASKELKIGVDVHNNEDPSHIIVWNLEAQEEPSEENEIFNSAENEEEEFSLTGQGLGIYWGLQLDKATVDTLQLKDAQEGHDHGSDHHEHGDDEHDD